MDQMVSIEHFLHRSHRLEPEIYTAGTEHLCNGCNMNIPGLHKGYHCNFCNFNLHEYCGTCPGNLYSFMHPHPLTLFTRTPEDTFRTACSCNVCHDQVQGMFYRCDCCDFNVHPLCTQLPEHVSHVWDRLHSLRLESSPHGWCAVCGGPCTSWRYCCGLCGLDIHFDCVLKQCDPATLTQRTPELPVSQSRSLSRSRPPPYGGFAHGVSYAPSPPPTYGGYVQGVSYVPSQPPTYGGYGHGVSYGPPPTTWPPTYGHEVSYGPPTPSWPPPYGYHYTVPHAYTSTPYNTHNCVYPPQEGGATSTGSKIGKVMAHIVAGLQGIGTIASVIIGLM